MFFLLKGNRLALLDSAAREIFLPSPAIEGRHLRRWVRR
jgi:hypothetical protein